MRSDRILDKRLNITGAFKHAHNHRLDSVFDGRHLKRLPDRSLVYGEDYERKLKEYRRTQDS